MSTFDKPPVEQPKEPAAEQPAEMNLFTNYDATMRALIEMEGEEWFSTQEQTWRGIHVIPPNMDYSIQGAMRRAKDINPERHTGSVVLYGASGTHRYYVQRNGEVQYSASHGEASAKKAHRLGFVIHGAELLEGRFKLDAED